MIFKPLQDPRGVSLIELMIATLVFSLVAAFGMRFLVLQHQWFILQENTADAQQQGRTALDFMEHELSLLGFGLPGGEATLLKADEQEVQFLANLDAAVARMTQVAQAGQKQLFVRYENRSDPFEQGKTVLICAQDYCERRSLAQDAGIGSLELNEGLKNTFPSESTVQVINQVRYALRPMDSTQFKLIRTVDGGSNPVAEGLTSMKLEYLNREGRTVTDVDDIHRVRIWLTARVSGSLEKVRSLADEVYLRNHSVQ